MNPLPFAELELERYEITAGPLYRFRLDRRSFLQALGGGLAFFLLVDSADALAQETGRELRRTALPRNIGAWLHLQPDGRVTVYTGKVEVGQNVRTSLAQQVAEELRVAIEQISMVMGDTAQTPFDLGTFGSRTTPQMGTQLRRVAAAARQALIALAAERWQVPANRLRVSNGHVEDPATGQRISYGELAAGTALAQAVIADPALEPPTRWSIAGQSVPKVNGELFVTGRHRYTSDLRLPGMFYGRVLRPPQLGATLEALDASAAQALPGVVIVRDGDFVGVAAESPELADRALALLRPTWKTRSGPSRNTLFEDLRRTADTSAAVVHTSGDPAAARSQVERWFEATYTVEYIAHAPLEPRAAVARWEGNRLTVWTGTQRPFAVRDELAAAFHLPTEAVRVLVPDTGSAYGGKHTGEAALEAARLARAAGRPVKLVWTRQEEFTWAYFRPAGILTVRAGLDAIGRLRIWEFENYNSGTAALATPYTIPHQRIAFYPAQAPLRQGSYRALAATANHFARESAMDELARLAGRDPLEFRLAHLDDERLKDVFRTAAATFGWSAGKRPPGQGVGIAGGVEKGGRVATCAEVHVDRQTGRVVVVRLVTAFECGAIVNPDGLRNQIEGAMIQGLGGALFEAVDFAKGQILTDRFSRYRVPRFRDVPQLQVVLVNRPDQPPAGAGETPIVGVAPAIANAIFDACGVRLRALPLLPGERLPNPTQAETSGKAAAGPGQ